MEAEGDQEGLLPAVTLWSVPGCKGVGEPELGSEPGSVGFI